MVDLEGPTSTSGSTRLSHKNFSAAPAHEWDLMEMAIDGRLRRAELCRHPLVDKELFFIH